MGGANGVGHTCQSSRRQALTQTYFSAGQQVFRGLVASKREKASTSDGDSSKNMMYLSRAFQNAISFAPFVNLVKVILTD